MSRTHLFLIGCFMLGMLVGSFVTCDASVQVGSGGVQQSLGLHPSD